MSVSNFQIPTTNDPQTFEITLAGVTYTVTFRWNDAEDAGWILDIADATGNVLVCNIPLITGENCLAGLEYLGINGSLFVMTDGDTFAVPTLENFGDASKLYFQTSVSDG